MTAIDELPPLRETIRRHGLSAKKSLGQNFLLDLNLTTRIARAGGSLAGVTVLEIGPGPGGLTRALLANGARHVIAVERDRRAIAALGEIATHYSGKLTVIEGDALEMEWTRAPAPFSQGNAFGQSPLEGAGSATQHSGRSRQQPTSVGGGGDRHGGQDGAVRIIANLPYNIATALLVRWLGVEPWPPWYDSLVLMFQREVAERIIATPASRQYGRLAVLAGWRTEAKIMFDVAPSAFVPPPKVTSSVVRLLPRASPLPCASSALERVTAAAFGQRRKMLRQSLRALGTDPQPILAAAGIDPAVRAEEISVEGFVALANAFEAARADARLHPKDQSKPAT
ncbi:MAG TPA: rRNA adenine dimethyltransferase family protein [Xanthobacteraceae bacterium]|nr:rRNA adenine dimethyltransferase family protein [Xanthobacteraceae bacterium]